MMKLTSGQWKAVFVLAGAALSALGVFFPQYAAGFEKLAMALGGLSVGVVIRGPGHVDVVSHPDDLQ